MPDIQFPSNGDDAPGYLAKPASGAGPAVVVLQEWWGLDDPVRRICERLASEGFFALAPDIYRGEPTTQPDKAEQKMMAMSMDRAVGDMSGAADYLASLEGVEGDRVGVVGFCLGGGLAAHAAAASDRIAATVIYYYVMPHGKPDFSSIDSPVLGHFGTADDFVPTADAEALEREMAAATGSSVRFEYYEGAGHAFANDHDRLGTYDEAKADQAWQSTVAFLRENLA